MCWAWHDYKRILTEFSYFSESLHSIGGWGEENDAKQCPTLLRGETLQVGSAETQVTSTPRSETAVNLT